MCGIVGVIGNPKATNILIHGLERLEYRGYDSAGIYVQGEKSYLVKSVGRIAQLKALLTPEVQGMIGIGHTRWATHGKPSEENAHPHTADHGRFVLVHNGVIENYQEIKDHYLADDTFYGDTDTEIAVHLIAKMTLESGSTEEGLRQALKIIKGSYAFALIDQEDPDTIYVAKNKSPLLLGVGAGYNMVCSDAMAMINETNQFVEIHDMEMVLVHADRYEIKNLAGEIIRRLPFTAEIDAADLEKGTYPFYMLKEIDEQPTVMRRIASEYFAGEEVKVAPEILEAMKESDRIYIVACGTSWHAGWVGKFLFENLCDLPVEVLLSSEVGYRLPLLSQKPFFIFPSQSGETADTRQVLVETKRLGIPSLTLTNVPGSTLAREATFSLPLLAGPEIAVASTKAYTAQIAVLACLAKAAGEALGKAAAQDFDLKHQLGLVANGMEEIFTEKDLLEQQAYNYLTDRRNAFYIGRGPDYYVSMEAALKLKEISYIQAEGFAAGELKHGTIALIEEGTPVFGVITDAVTASHTRGNLQEVESRGAHTYVISMKGLEKAEDNLVLPRIDPLLTPLLSVVPAQLIAYYATIQRHLDVDKPRNLAKSVTVE